MQTGIQIRENVLLSPLTTFKIGGPARYFVEVTTIEELEESVQFGKEKNVPFFVLAGGSNILIKDEGFYGVVIKMAFKGVEFIEKEDDQTEVICAAGENWDGLVKETVERGLFGIENLSGIPGSVGAAPIQNIGAYGSEMKDTLQWLEVFDTETGELTRLSNSECGFGYRDSIFKEPGHKHLIVTRVCFLLSKNGSVNVSYKDLANYFFPKKIEQEQETKSKIEKETEPTPKPTLGEVRESVLTIRAGKFPDLKEVGTAGSFFNNPIISKEHFERLKLKFPDLPGFELEVDSGVDSGEEKVKVPLAWILDNVCQLKGERRGSVGLFKNQPLALVNYGVNSGGGSASEVKAFGDEVAQVVKEKTGIEIEWEVTFVG